MHLNFWFTLFFFLYDNDANLKINNIHHDKLGLNFIILFKEFYALQIFQEKRNTMCVSDDHF